jgi:hypothetical protein
VQTATGEISGHVTGLESPIRVWAISPYDGSAHVATTSAQGIFAISNLPVSQYQLVVDPQEMAKQDMALRAESIDLTQSPSTQVNLTPLPLNGASLTGKITDQAVAALPFTWVDLESQIGQTDPASGEYSLFGLRSAQATAIISAPGYYSQAQIIKKGNTNASSVNISLVRRPETMLIPWGDGAITIPPETISSQAGQIINFEQGWLWGQGGSKQPLVINWEDIQITIPDGQFALESLPARPGWLYIMYGEAFMQQTGTAGSITVHAGEMAFLSQNQQPRPVPYDPVIAGALLLTNEVPINPAWQPSLAAQVRDRLARLGIGTAQAVTFITYLMEVIALLVMVFLAVKWILNMKRKEKNRG